MAEMTEEQRKAYEEKLKNMSPEELKEFQKQQCIFCQIIAGKIPSKKVYEDDKCIAVLDINPAAKGHVLLLPKEHYAIMPQVPEKEIAHLTVVSKYLSQIVLKVLRASGTNIFIANGFAAGQKAQHFMIHLIPRKEGDGLLNIQEKLITREMQEKVAGAVINRLNALLGVKTTPPKETKAPLPQENEEQPIIEEKSQPPHPPIRSPLPQPFSQSISPPEEKKKKPIAEEEEESEEEQRRENVSLDDIANLFK